MKNLYISISCLIASIAVYVLYVRTEPEGLDIEDGKLSERIHKDAAALAGLESTAILLQDSSGFSNSNGAALQEINAQHIDSLKERNDLWNFIREYATPGSVAGYSFISFQKLNEFDPEKAKSMVKRHGGSDELIGKIPDEWNTKQLKTMKKGRQALIGLLAASSTGLVMNSIGNTAPFKWWIITALMFLFGFFLWRFLQHKGMAR